MTFSDRHGLSEPPETDPSKLIRDDAPESVRAGVLALFQHTLGPTPLRAVVCRVLRRRPDPGNWSEYPNIWREVEDLVYGAPWYKVYDIVEAGLQTLRSTEYRSVTKSLNALFEEERLAWRIVDGDIQLRTGEVTERVVAHAVDALNTQGRPTAAGELQKAMRALSQRPNADTRDAVRCALGAIEALARDITGDRSDTLGEILKRKGDSLLKPPLPQALSQIWGYASDVARHVDETKAPTLPEAVFVVGVVGAAVALMNSP